MQNVVILGTTGSIGSQAYEVIKNAQNKYNVIGISAYGTNAQLLNEQIKFYKPKYVGLINNSNIKYRGNVITGLDANLELLNNIKEKNVIVLNAIAGYDGLLSSIKTIEKGWCLALANKESLVLGGFYINKIKKFDDQILPVDSEHSAIYQCIAGQKNEVNKLILTASGGPFKNYKSLKNITPKKALKHPTWNMGPLVTINSATLFNKALELIEAHYMFDVPEDKIDVVIHPQSIIHSAVEFIDNSVIAQMSYPDMKLPIGLALCKYKHSKSNIKQFLWDKTLTFEKVNNTLFPAIELARVCLRKSHLHPTVLNVSNEICVKKFLENNLSFENIFVVVQKILKMFDKHYKNISDKNSLNAILQTINWTKEKTDVLIKSLYVRPTS